MGLDVFVVKGTKHYHRSYSAIHLVRWESYKSVGGTKDYHEFMNSQKSVNDEKYEKVVEVFPNLNWHSDCEGSYTMKGKVASFKSVNLYTGSLPGLKKELDDLAPWMNKNAQPHIVQIFKEFKACVDEAFKLKTKIRFC